MGKKSNADQAAPNTKKRKDKLGRNKFDCLAYKNNNQREKNKLKKLEKHLRKFPNDPNALAAVEACNKAIRGF